ncbi:hypothetical protein CIHG_07533 [Coccidioides immitis H538.4]|uniref:DUF3074 domain-containing protein n=1 Tax=Coccidioides immitis H538.4 TaxID=396776 RepID=A0A0J8RXH6_COCIT|nr:hypothetical protein CIHG_07533 [Coccidioides immitis H538.4]
MAALHAALQSLQPVSIEEIPTSNEGLCTYIRDLLIQARLIVESVPEPPSPPTTSNLPAGSKSPTNAEDSSENPPCPRRHLPGSHKIFIHTCIRTCGYTLNYGSFVRGQYESVEMIRELPAPIEGDSSGASENKGDANPVEWIMITRSDPGGSIPRWMVEKGTVPSIVSDAKKFIDWASQDQPKSESTDEDFSTSQPSHDSGKYEEKQQQLKTGPGERVSKQCTPGRQAPAKERRSSEVKSSHGEVDSMPSHEVGFAAGIVQGVSLTLKSTAPKGLFDYIDLPTTSKHPGDETDESQVNDGIRDGGGNVTRTSTASRNMNNASPSSSTASFVSADSQLGDMQGNKEDSIPNSPGIGNNNSPVMFNTRVTSSTSNSIFSLKQEFTPPNAYDKELARIFDRKNKVLRDLELNHSQRNELVSQVSQPHAPDVNASDEIQERIASPSKRGKDATSNKRSLATLERKEVKLNSQLNKIEAQQQKIAAKIELKRRKELEKDERISLKAEVETLKKEMDRMKVEISRLRQERGQWMDLDKDSIQGDALVQGCLSS